MDTDRESISYPGQYLDGFLKPEQGGRQPARGNDPVRCIGLDGSARVVRHLRIHARSADGIVAGAATRTIARIPDYKINRVDELLPWKWNG
jgi:hypothetical protein